VKTLGVLLILAMGFLLGCEYTPENRTVLTIEGKREYDRGYIEPVMPEGEARPIPTRLKWIDTNTWITSSTLSPGQYRFTARTNEGKYYGSDVTVVEGQARYRMPEIPVAKATPVAANKVSGELSSSDPKVLNGEVGVLFTGKSTAFRQTRAAQGRFSVPAPPPGRYRVHVNTLGENPLAHSTQLITIQGDHDLGQVPVK